MESKGYFNPRRSRPHDADLCVEAEDGSWRDAAGRLIYRPGRIYIMKTVPSAQHIPPVFGDATWDEYDDERRLQAPEVHYHASLEGIRDWLVTQGVV